MRQVVPIICFWELKLFFRVFLKASFFQIRNHRYDWLDQSLPLACARRTSRYFIQDNIGCIKIIKLQLSSPSLVLKCHLFPLVAVEISFAIFIPNIFRFHLILWWLIDKYDYLKLPSSLVWGGSIIHLRSRIPGAVLSYQPSMIMSCKLRIMTHFGKIFPFRLAVKSVLLITGLQRLPHTPFLMHYAVKILLRSRSCIRCFFRPKTIFYWMRKTLIYKIYWKVNIWLWLPSLAKFLFLSCYSR